MANQPVSGIVWDAAGGWVAYANPGPSGGNIPVGTYYVWVRIVDGVLGETPIVQVGRLIVQ